MTSGQIYLAFWVSFFLSYPVFAYIQWKWTKDYITAVVMIAFLVVIFSVVWVLLDFWFSLFFTLYALIGMILSSMISSWIGKQS